MKVLTRIVVFVLAGSLLFIGGCDTLNLKPKDEIASKAVWKDPKLVKAYLNDVYGNVGYGFGSPTTSGATDEAVFTHGWGVPPVRMSNMTPSELGIWGISWRDTFRRFAWGEVYGTIRDINLFLKNVKGSEAFSSKQKGILLGEAYFLRAYFYHNLMRIHGGVPLIKKPFKLSGNLEKYQVPRNSFKETINFIAADLDRAAQRLPLEGRVKGAATKGAAMALECRVRLYAASDLYAANKSPFDSKLVKYTGGSQQQRWQKAKTACKDVIDLGQYSLEQTETAREYHKLFTKGNPSGNIWARYFSETVGSVYNGQHNISLWSSPNGYNAWGGDTPTQQHVNAYEMADGSQFKWEGADPRKAGKPVDAKNPYDNRDPRFYANIMYNGKNWRPRPSGAQSLDPKGIIQTGWYEMPNQNTLRPGLDTREGPIQPWNGTKSGYYVAKFVDRGILPSQAQAQPPWPFLRYAEVLLNYAEASAELGDTQDALRALNKVRNRVGMPDVPADGGPNRTLMERIRQEREVELAFEEHRYFDARRWMTAPEVFGEDARGIRVVGRLASKDNPEAQKLVNHWYDYEYNVVKVVDHRWKNRNYFVPIPESEMTRNPKLKQNPGY